MSNREINQFLEQLLKGCEKGECANGYAPTPKWIKIGLVTSLVIMFACIWPCGYNGKSVTFYIPCVIGAVFGLLATFLSIYLGSHYRLSRDQLIEANWRIHLYETMRHIDFDIDEKLTNKLLFDVMTNQNHVHKSQVAKLLQNSKKLFTLRDTLNKIDNIGFVPSNKVDYVKLQIAYRKEYKRVNNEIDKIILPRVLRQMQSIADSGDHLNYLPNNYKQKFVDSFVANSQDLLAK